MLVSPTQALKGRLLLLVDWLNQPTSCIRSDKEMRALTRETQGLAFYHHRLCPVCIRTRRVIKQLNIPLETRDIRRSQVYRDDVLAGAGKIKMPCLKIEKAGATEWLQGVDEILSYLLERFSPDDNKNSE